jgi:hypothetical protein
MDDKPIVLRRGRVIVCKNAIHAISFEEPFDYKEQYGFEGTAPGTVHLHLVGGGRINISSQTPATEAHEWAVLADLI